MMSKCDEIHAIPPKTSNQWSTQSDEMVEDHHIKVSSMASSSSSSVRVMEKPGQDLLQQQHQALKCPRCDSSNTKFCYYNNYNLSQPRHFCKACKRYWTRGGTLRNVPVGGGCRKNKRLKRHAPTAATATTSSTTTTTATASPSHNSAASNAPPNSQTQINPLFYGNSCDVMNLVPFPGFSGGSRASSSGYDLHQPQNQLNGALGGLGFMPGDDNGYRIHGFGSNNNAFVSSYNSIFGSSNSAPATPVMASLLSSSLMQHKFMKDDVDSHSFQQGLGAPVEELQVRGNSGNGSSTVMASKEVKADEQGQERLLEWTIGGGGGGGCQNNQQQMEHVPLSDPSLYWNTPTALGAWISDQSNSIGPNSLTSLI